jgi:Protein of unknown function (DUF3187)
MDNSKFSSALMGVVPAECDAEAGEYDRLSTDASFDEIALACGLGGQRDGRTMNIFNGIRRRLGLITFFIGLIATGVPGPVLADGGGFYGPLRSRDLTPFGFLRLDMRPAHAVNIEPGTWAFETEIDYQNTWALSKEVERYLVGLEAEGRRKLGPSEVQAIRDLPGENYMLDFEGVMFSFAAHYKLTSHWSAYGILSAVKYGGGFLDGTIEGFHDTFGFSTFGRPAAARNQTTLIYDLRGAQAVFLESPSDGGMLDPVFGVRFSGVQLSPVWRLSFESTVKVPLQGKRLLLSTGRTDYGLQAALQRTGVRHAFYLNTAAVYYAGASEPAAQDSQIVPTLILGYEFKWTKNTNLNLQTYVSKSVYSHRQTDLDELLGPKYQYSIGLRHRRENWLWTIGFNENVQNVNNTPDVGLQFGVAWIPGGAER